MEIRPVGDALIHADGQTERTVDMTKVRNVFRDYAKNPHPLQKKKKASLTNYWHNRLYESGSSHDVSILRAVIMFRNDPVPPQRCFFFVLSRQYSLPET